MAARILLNRQDRDPVRKIMPSGRGSAFVLIGDHAGSAIPASLGDLGLAASDRERHIALDIGIAELGRSLAGRLEAPFVSQIYSRLVVDCNRDPRAPGWIVTESDGTPVPGNANLTRAEREARRDEIFEPYHSVIAALLDDLAEHGRDPVLVALHSFAPALGGVARPWHVGVLHDGRRDAFALEVLAELRGRSGLVVGDNEPYRMDATDYTVPRHAYPRGLRYVEIEVRQDLLADAAGIAWGSEILAEVLTAALG